MSLGRLLRRASSKASDLLTLTTGGSSGSPSVLDGEIIYSKNNVCVHAPEGLQGPGEHHPGEMGSGSPSHSWFLDTLVVSRDGASLCWQGSGVHSSPLSLPEEFP